MLETWRGSRGYQQGPKHTHVDGHVEIVGFEGVSHLPEALQGVFPRCLLETKSLRRSLALLKKRDGGSGWGSPAPQT